LGIPANSTDEIMKFAGCRNDMPDEEFDNFLKKQRNPVSRHFQGKENVKTFTD